MSTSVAETLELGKALLFAARDGDMEKVSSLLDRNAPFVNDWLGSTPLHFACKNSHTKIVDILLKAGISKDARTKVEKTPLHFAASNGQAEIVQMLLSRGAQPNCIDMLGMSPLHWACENQHFPCVRVLLESKADVNIVNKFGKTAADIARGLNRKDIFYLIVNHTAGYRSIEPKVLEITSSNSHEHDEDNNPPPDSKELAPKTEPKCYPRRKSKSQGGSAPKRKKIEDDNLEKVLPLFQDQGSLSPSEAERQAQTMRLLETHGIKMLPNDDSTIVASAVQSGQTVCLTEAGKMALKAIEMPSLPMPPAVPNNIVSQIENPAPSPKKPPKKTQTAQLVHVNPLNFADNSIEGKRIIKIRADQLIDMKKRNQVLIRPVANIKSTRKIMDNESELRDALNSFQMDESSNSFRIEESDFDEVMKQLSASQALVKLYRQQLINKEKELQLYKQLLLKKSNELKNLQRAQLLNLSKSV